MKIPKFIVPVVVLVIFGVLFAVWSSKHNAPTVVVMPPPMASSPGDSIKEQVVALVAVINKKIELGARKEGDLTEELKQFDAILAAHPGDKSNDAAEVLAVEGQLYGMVLNDPEKALAIFQRLSKDFPDTDLAKQTAQVIPDLQKGVAAEAVHKQLVVGSVFPVFSVTCMDGKMFSLLQYRGKVVLVDFWATWCGPCMVEVPDVVDAYTKYHPSGFEIIGISLDEDPQELLKVIDDRKMPWPEFNDGKKWENQLAVKYGIMQLPSNFLLDGDGKIIAIDIRGGDLGAAVAKALGK